MPRHRRARKLKLRHAAAGVVALAGLPLAMAGAATVSADQPTTGTVSVVASSLSASNTAGNTRLFMNFDIPGVPAGATIRHAELVVSAAQSLPSSLQVEDGALTTASAVTSHVRTGSRSAVIDVTRLVKRSGRVSLSLAPM